MAHSFDIDRINRSFPGWSEWLREHDTACTASADPSQSNVEVARLSLAKMIAGAGGAGSVSGHPTMEGVSEALMHGIDGVGRGWNPPVVTLASDVEARPGYNSMKAEEYHDDPETLQKKITVLADLVRKSQHFVTYTGAGISTSSGIGDYASKGKKSAAKAAIAKAGKVSHLDACPTLAHFTLAALHSEGYLKHWVQQNHDGLPQKAGYPQHALNEIHGAWFDPSNPVVPMSGTLRDDLCDWMCQEEDNADLVLAMGTSLCGMNADRMVETPGQKRIRDKIGLGSVIVGFQRTRLDSVASLRIFASIDEVMLLLARELALTLNPKQYKPSTPPANHTFDVPYDIDGKPWQKGKTQLCLVPGTKVKLTSGPGKGFVGTVSRTPVRSAHNGEMSYAYEVMFPCTREGSIHFGKSKRLYALGAWMVDEAVRGELHVLPIVNTI